MQAQSLFFIDFDGVICDSLPECYETSRRAYPLWRGDEETAHLPTDSDSRARFRAMRPLIRRGGDYLILQRALSQGIDLTSQEAFDHFARPYLPEKAAMEELFQNCRANFLSKEPERWFSLNPIYPGMKELLTPHRLNPMVLILSTKPSHFIHQILSFHGLQWPEEEILCAQKREKIEMIDELLDQREAADTYLLDDQLSHLLASSRHQVHPLLAAWGYLLDPWKSDSRVRTVDMDTFSELLR